MMKNHLIKYWQLYQRCMWYIAQFGGEIGKPMRFVSEMLIILTFIKVQLDYSVTAWQTITIYVIIMLSALFLGRLLVAVGTVKYNTTLSNNHNKELTEILHIIKRLEKQRWSK